MSKTITCIDTGKIYTKPIGFLLPARKNTKKYRYRGVFGDKLIGHPDYANTPEPVTDLLTALEYAWLLDEKYRGVTIPHDALEPLNGNDKVIGWCTAHAEKFIKELGVTRERDTQLITADISRQRLFAFAREMDNYKQDKVDSKLLHEWWHGIDRFSHVKQSYATQRKNRTILRKFFSEYANINNLFPNVPYNVFETMNAGGFMLKSRPKKKQQPLDIDQYNELLVLSKGTYFNWMLRFAAATGLRQADICALTFERDAGLPHEKTNYVMPRYWDKQANQLVVMTEKSYNLTGFSAKDATLLRWNLSEENNKDVLDLLLEAEQTRNEIFAKSGVMPATIAHTIFSQKPQELDKNGNKIRIDKHSIIPRDVQKRMRFYREKIDSISGLQDAFQKAGFHETRALYAFIKYTIEGWPLKEISRSLGHTDVETLLENYSQLITTNEYYVGVADDHISQRKAKMRQQLRAV